MARKSPYKPLLSILTVTLICLMHNRQTEAKFQDQHPDLAGLLALQATICNVYTQPCAELVSWNTSVNPCTWEGVYCGYIAGVWRAVSIHLQLDAKAVLLNDSAAVVNGTVPQLPHLRELELMCLSPKKPAGPTPANAQDLLLGVPVQHSAGLQDIQSSVAAYPAAGQQAGISEDTDVHVGTSSVSLQPENWPADQQQATTSAPATVTSSSSSSSNAAESSTGSSYSAAPSLTRPTAAPGELPPRWFEAYPQLSTLRVVGCGVTGSLPEALTAARQLNSVVLSHNKLRGSLPDKMVQLQGLMLLDLSHNGLSGTLPRQWSSLSQLSYLYLNSNNLTLDELPCEWGSGMMSLKLADLSGNKVRPHGVSGAIAAGRCSSASLAAGAGYAAAASIGAGKRTLLDGVEKSARSAAAVGRSSNSSNPGSSVLSATSSRDSISATAGGLSSSLMGPQHGASLYAPRCWLRRFCYQEGAFICLQRSLLHPAGGCTSYVYGASDLHIDALNQCDHGGVHLIAILCLWVALFTVLLLIWLHHCRLLRWMVQPPPDQAPAPWQQPYQRQWLVTGPPPASSVSSSRDRALPLLYNQPRTRDDAAGFVRPPSPFSAGLGGGSVSPVESAKSESLPSALVTPPATSCGARYMLVRGFGLMTAFSAGYDDGGGVGGPGAGRLSRLGRTTLVPGLGRDRSVHSCFSAALLLPLVMLLLDVITDVRLVLLWGLSPAHYKLWPSYVLLGFLCVPHVLVGAVVNFRLLAAACLPPALEAASPGLVADILPPGALLIKQLYGYLFAASWFVAYPLILVLLGPMTALLTVLCPLTLVIHAVGLASHESVVRYVQLVQGCAALTEAPGSAVLLTVLFLMGNLPLEWAFLDSALYYLNVVTSMADMAVAWYIKLAGIRRQQLMELASPSTDHW